MSEEAQVNSGSEESGPQSIGDAVEAMTPEQRGKFRLAKLAAIHAVVWLVAMGLFAAADSWRMLSDLALASVLAVLTGIFAGIVTSNLLHEWGHYFGARRSGGAYTIPENVGVFVYDWDFKSNNVDQFMTMSIAGTIGGAVALILIWMLVPTDTLARAALLAGAVASFAFGARIEWPILRRVRDGAEPLTELSKIDQGVLSNSFFTATVVGLIALWLFSP